MGQYEIWQLKPEINFYIHHENLETFVKPITQVPHWTLMIIRSGSFLYDFENLNGKISGECFFLCPPYKKLERKIINPMTFDYMRLDFIYPDGTNANLFNKIPSGIIKISSARRVYANSSYLQHLSTRHDAFSRHWMNHIASELWYICCAETSGVSISFDMQSSDTLMNNSVDLMKKLAPKRIDIKSVADMVGLSPVQFTRRFKAAFNMKPSEYLTTLRIQLIQRLLFETDLTLSQIADKVGYQNEYYLSKVFTDKVAINPSAYRKLHML